MAEGDRTGTGEAEKSVIRPTDDAAITLAKTLLRSARYAAISVLEPETGHPFVSRILLGTDYDGVPVVLASTLATHMKAMIADPRTAILVGEPGKGDPLAWPRMTVLSDAVRIDRDTDSDLRIRARFLRRHPKAKLYADFRDFSFVRLVPKSASLNGGFARAYNISGDELIIRSRMTEEPLNHEAHLISEIEKLGCNVATQLACFYFREKTDNWYVIGVDAEGLDLARKEKILRLHFAGIQASSNGLIAECDRLLKNVISN